MPASFAIKRRGVWIHSHLSVSAGSEAGAQRQYFLDKAGRLAKRAGATLESIICDAPVGRGTLLHPHACSSACQHVDELSDARSAGQRVQLFFVYARNKIDRGAGVSRNGFGYLLVEYHGMACSNLSVIHRCTPPA